jgi:hypothetical protein
MGLGSFGAPPLGSGERLSPMVEGALQPGLAGPQK